MEVLGLKNTFSSLDADEDHVFFGIFNNLDGLDILHDLEIFYGFEALGNLELLILRHLS